MNITLGDEIRIDGKQVPEYLQKALYACLAEKYGSPQTIRGVMNANALAGCISYAVVEAQCSKRSSVERG